MKPEHYINRELSWLEFNNRVLQEAKDETNPLLERLKFLSIFSSNLDEFFMVRVSSIVDLINGGLPEPEPSGLTPAQELERISLKIQDLTAKLYRCYNNLLPELAQHNLQILRIKDLNEQQRGFLQEYYRSVVYPVLTPMAVDSSRPFPLILNRSLNLGILLRDEEDEQDREQFFASVQVPAMLPRLVQIDSSPEAQVYVFLEDIIALHLDSLFAGHKIICAYPYRITRSAEIDFNKDDTEDVLREIEKSIKKRKRGEAVRLEVPCQTDAALLDILKKELQIADPDVYRIRGPLDLSFFMKFYNQQGREELKFPPFQPGTPPELQEDIPVVDLLKKKDIFLHHPYDAFDPVIRFVHEAAHDPKVLAIKMTLYRVSGDSPIIAALAQAAENGKQVTVVVELKARFDEENNIIWAKKLEQAGCHVIYGLVGLKIHCKIILIVRNEENGIRRYVHLGTGNYNDTTARIYSDMGLFSSNEYIGADASALFNMLTGYSEPPGWHKLSVAPLSLREKLLDLINREAENAREKKTGHIIAKMNSLVDTEIIDALYRASQAGVRIELIVRGICCLRLGVRGLSENISVRSIVGRFLEHSRAFYFYNNGWEDVFLSSADWMPRNLNKRVEILFPVEDRQIKEEVIGILEIMLQDNVKARFLSADGRYKRAGAKANRKINSQEFFCILSLDKKNEPPEQNSGTFFTPITTLE